MFLTRQSVCERLRMSQSASYREPWLRPRRHMVSSQDVLAMLNRSARAGLAMFAEDGQIPDAMTADEVEAATGYPARRLVLATRHARNPLPHWRINSHVVRFHLPSVLDWLRS